ncbi:sensor histidine kinase [Devosia sp. SL43]|uniref:sensor histidine kinase n=1 Tax=Devosia sp. SL43 TaxID=2806348 RepID=UPI001F43EACC|nr:CHASE3 domain-containing protein [Devosia sp. SL43]UJW87118.1 CHASE3 domain-containing protein [Devosia sp. SL43]
MRRIGRRVAIWASLSLVLLAAVASLVLVQSMDRQIGDMARTYDVRNQARELTIALSETESSQRGYVLTRDDSYLQTYRRAAADIDASVLALIAVTDDDPSRAARVNDITGDIAAKIAEMARTVDLVNSQRTAEARTLIQTGMGERLMDEVRAALEQFISDENQNLLDRNRSIDTMRLSLVGAIVAALAGAVILAYILFTRTQREVTALAQNRNLLRSEKEELESLVRERTQAVEEARAHAERERERVEALLQDSSHRIGNSLATVSSLLGLQLIRSKSDEVRQALEAARSRVHAIASAHRRLRLGDDLETASADDFLDAVLEDLASTVTGTKAVTLTGEIDPIVIGARDATTVGILVGELVTNALKHAFPEDRSGTVTVRLRRDADGVPTLTVTDDGVGIAEDSQPGEGGLGSVIVKQLANQFGGVPQYLRREGGGLSVVVPLPGIDKNVSPPA